MPTAFGRQKPPFAIQDFNTDSKYERSGKCAAMLHQVEPIIRVKEPSISFRCQDFAGTYATRRTDHAAPLQKIDDP